MGRLNRSSKKLSIYDFNIHKMVDRWQGWLEYIRDNPIPLPDIILVQDLADKAQRQLLLSTLAKELGGTWDGRGYADDWHPAVVWRKERFEKPTSRSWRGYAGNPCAFGSDRSPAVQVRLRDRVAQRWITCVSFKSAPERSSSCAQVNAAYAHGKMSEPGWTGDLMIMGTDANDPARAGTGWTQWYSCVNGRLVAKKGSEPLGYTDPIFEVTNGDPTLLRKHATRKNGGRIDYLFLRTPAGPAAITDGETLPLGDDTSWWSDHASLRTLVNY